MFVRGGALLAEDLIGPGEDPGWPEVPDTVPDWLLAAPLMDQPLGCDCGCTCVGAGVGVGSEDPIFWATPGVTGLAEAECRALAAGALPSPSDLVAAVQALAERVIGTDPAALPIAQALADAQALLAVEQQLRVHSVARAADVAARGGHELLGYRSPRTWLRDQRPDGDGADASLGVALRSHPVLAASVATSATSLGHARKVLFALKRCRPHVDRGDGLIDGQPAAEVISAVIGHVPTLVCEHWMGVADDDPRLLALLARTAEIQQQVGAPELALLEAAFTLLAEHVPVRTLTGLLDMLVTAVLPRVLEERDVEGQGAAGLTLERKDDGTGWRLRGDLTLECGERLFTALRAEAHRDPENTQDTEAWRQLQNDQALSKADAHDALKRLRDAPEGLWGAASADVRLPRSARRRLHDALSNLLGRTLDSGVLGSSRTVPVQVSVTLTEQQVTGRPGALPARASSGALIPTGTVRRWWCDAKVTAFVLSLGGKALRTVHTRRTVSSLERQGRALETGASCAGAGGCCDGRPDPLQALIPHHPIRYEVCGTTSIEATVMVCPRLHRDLHEGKRTVLLRDGRYLNEAGFTDRPSLFDAEPF